MSPGAVSERIDRLERTGVIRGYHAALDPAAMGFPMEIIVGLQIQQGLPLQDLVARVLEIPEVVAVHVVTGQWDLVVTLRARDQRHLHELIIGRLWEVPGFRHSESMLVLETSERSGAWFGGTSVPHEAEQGARGASPRQAKPSPKR
jgi:DNA-binding Lrp family transcriptional regulator